MHRKSEAGIWIKETLSFVFGVGGLLAVAVFWSVATGGV